jgi:hypothetical protein
MTMMAHGLFKRPCTPPHSFTQLQPPQKRHRHALWMSFAWIMPSESLLCYMEESMWGRQDAPPAVHIVHLVARDAGYGTLPCGAGDAASSLRILASTLGAHKSVTVLYMVDIYAPLALPTLTPPCFTVQRLPSQP